MIYVNELWKLGIIMTSLRLPERRETSWKFGAGFGKLYFMEINSYPH